MIEQLIEATANASVSRRNQDARTVVLDVSVRPPDLYATTGVSQS
jgi:hypothetical protein